MTSGSIQKRITSLFFTCIFAVQIAHSQTYFCGHNHEEHQHLELTDTMSTASSDLRLSAGGVTYYPIQAHILKKTVDTAATTSLEVVKAIMTLNKNWEKANIQFYLSDPIHFVIDTFYNYNSLYSGKLASLYNRPGVINVYFVKSILYYLTPQDQNPSVPIGLAVVGGSTNDPVIIDGDFASNDILLTHEMGHYFSLQHVLQDGSGNYMQPTSFEGAGNFTQAQYTAISNETLLARKTVMAKTTLAPVATPTGPQATFIEYSTVKLSWKDNATNELGYIIERSLNPDSGFMQVNLVDINAQEAFDYQAQSNTLYYYRVKAGNSLIYSPVVSITTGIVYCHPQNEFPCTGAIPDVSMKSLSISTVPIFVNSINDCHEFDYLHPTSLKFKRDSSYSFTITMGTTAAIKNKAFVDDLIKNQGFSSFTVDQIQYKLNIVIWIDLNKNGIFEASEIKYNGFAANNSTQILGAITMPSVAPLKTLMRIRAIWKASVFFNTMNIMKTVDACSAHTEGETEDYLVEIGDVVTETEDAQNLGLATFFPNPSHGELSLSKETLSCDILDLRGNVLLHLKNSEPNHIQTLSLTNGVYLVRLLDTHGANRYDKLCIEK